MRKVTKDNFIIAETDRYFSNHVKNYPVNTICHSRELSSVKSQFAIRENHDTLYSRAVIDISEGAVIVNPERDEYSTVHVIDEHHYTVGVMYAGDSLILTKDMVTNGGHVFLKIRTGIRTLSEAGYCEAHRHQDSILVRANSFRPYVTKGFDKKSLDEVRVELQSHLNKLKKPWLMFGLKDEVDQDTFLIASAAIWGGLPAKHALYITYIQPSGDAEFGECSSITIPPPPLQYDKGAFFSIVTYNEDGRIVKDKFALNNRQAIPNKDGSYTFYFNCPEENNNIDIDINWTMILRLYVPGSPAEILAYVENLQKNSKIVV